MINQEMVIQVGEVRDHVDQPRYFMPPGETDPTKGHFGCMRDANCSIATISGLKMFGVKTDILAAFKTEKEALDVLFAMEDGGLISGHTVRQITHATGEV